MAKRPRQYADDRRSHGTAVGNDDGIYERYPKSPYKADRKETKVGRGAARNMAGVPVGLHDNPEKPNPSGKGELSNLVDNLTNKRGSPQYRVVRGGKPAGTYRVSDPEGRIDTLAEAKRKAISKKQSR